MKFLKERRKIITDAHALYVVIFVLFVFSRSAFGQEKYNVAQPATIAGKTIAPVDSPMVNELFFSALREKTIENLTKAAGLFERVIQLDPANDASLYELANLKKLQNDYPTAQTLLEKAVSINQDNEWYWIALANCYEKK